MILGGYSSANSRMPYDDIKSRLAIICEYCCYCYHCYYCYYN